MPVPAAPPVVRTVVLRFNRDVMAGGVFYRQNDLVPAGVFPEDRLRKLLSNRIVREEVTTTVSEEEDAAVSAAITALAAPTPEPEAATEETEETEPEAQDDPLAGDGTNVINGDDLFASP